MARVRYIGPEPVSVPEIGRTIEPDEVVEVPDERFEGYVCQPVNWEGIEEPKDEKPSAAKKTTPAAKAASSSKEG